MNSYPVFLLILLSVQSIAKFSESMPYLQETLGDDMTQVSNYISSLGSQIFSEMDEKSKRLRSSDTVKELSPATMDDQMTSGSVFGRSLSMPETPENKIKIDKEPETPVNQGTNLRKLM